MIIHTKILENPIVLSKNYVTSIHTTDKHVYSKIAYQLFSLANGIDTDGYILEAGDEINAAKHTIFIASPFDIEYGNKKIQNAILALVESNINFDVAKKQHLEETYNKLYLEFCRLSEISELGISSSGEMDLKKLAKLFEISVQQEKTYTQLSDILQYLELISELKAAKIIVMTAIKSFFNEDELEEIFKMAIYCQLKLLLV
ncbi:MAG: type II-A CRISPR-associated protein Csn2, partial [Oscillospiraceae bacterium]